MEVEDVNTWEHISAPMARVLQTLAARMTMDAEIDAMSDGEFYHYMLDKDHYEWARQANRKLGLGLPEDAEQSLATYFASAMCAVEDRKHASYIRARLDAEKAEDAAE